jgi:Holliday junction resolvase RusA-like endonuclease
MTFEAPGGSQMRSVTFVVNSAPPWKQAPANKAEKRRQCERLQVLREKAGEVFADLPMISGHCAVIIRYSRNVGRADGANIIGGILDGLRGIAYQDDRQVTEITYREWAGDQDWYQVTVIELA